MESGALEEAQAACLRVSQLGERPDVYGPLAQRLQHVADWLRQRASVGLRDQGRDFFEGVWSGQQVQPQAKTSSSALIIRPSIPESEEKLTINLHIY